MKIAGHTFKSVNGTNDSPDPAVFLYKHLASGKYYVGSRLRAFKTILHTRIPKSFKEYVRAHPSDTALYVCYFKDATQKDLTRLTAEINKVLFAKGNLIDKRLLRHEAGVTMECNLSQTHFVWEATDTRTGAKYVFSAPSTHSLSVVTDSFQAKLITHTTHVRKSIRHANRTMHEYTRLHSGLDIKDWSVERQPGLHADEVTTRRAVIMSSRKYLQNSVVVLNRICDNDAVYYRNEIMKLENVSVQEYLDKCALAA